MWDALRIALIPSAFISGALIGTRRLRLDPRADLGLQLPSRRHAVLFSAAFLVLMAVEETAFWYFGNAAPADWRRKYDTRAVVLRVVFASLVYPIAEELFFRGFLLAVVRRKAGTLAAVVVTSILFTMLHGLSNPSLGTLQIFADAVFFAIVRLRSGSLILPAAFHVAGNTFAVLQRL